MRAALSTVGTERAVLAPLAWQSEPGNWSGRTLDPLFNFRSPWRSPEELAPVHERVETCSGGPRKPLYPIWGTEGSNPSPPLQQIVNRRDEFPAGRRSYRMMSPAEHLTGPREEAAFASRLERHRRELQVH
jgi:hypothetical protein